MAPPPIPLANWLWTWISLHCSIERLARSTRLGRSFLWRIHWKHCFAAWVGKGLVQLLRGKLPIQLWLKFERSHKPAWLSFCRHSPDWFGCRQTCFLKVFEEIYGRQLFSLGYWGRGQPPNDWFAREDMQFKLVSISNPLWCAIGLNPQSWWRCLRGISRKGWTPIGGGTWRFSSKSTAPIAWANASPHHWKSAFITAPGSLPMSYTRLIKVALGT